MSSALKNWVTSIFSSAKFSVAWLWDDMMSCHLRDKIIETDFYRSVTAMRPHRCVVGGSSVCFFIKPLAKC